MPGFQAERLVLESHRVEPPAVVMNEVVEPLEDQLLAGHRRQADRVAYHHGVAHVPLIGRVRPAQAAAVVAQRAVAKGAGESGVEDIGRVEADEVLNRREVPAHHRVVELRLGGGDR